PSLVFSWPLLTVTRLSTSTLERMLNRLLAGMEQVRLVIRLLAAKYRLEFCVDVEVKFKLPPSINRLPVSSLGLMVPRPVTTKLLLPRLRVDPPFNTRPPPWLEPTVMVLLFRLLKMISSPKSA